jgi:hypothetical protein
LQIKLTGEELLTLAGRVLDIESRAVLQLKHRLDGSFTAACELCLETAGRIVVTVMGKSGHIAGKIAATLASTGTPAFFMHPAEASHGDLAMITGQDLLLAVFWRNGGGDHNSAAGLQDHFACQETVRLHDRRRRRLRGCARGFANCF